MTGRIIFEVCIGSAEAAIAAQAGGADRVELCANLLEGGTTPSAGSIQLARQRIDIGLQVMIRPRGGDFCYTDGEFEIMKLDIAMAKKLGADGVVIGILNPDGAVDRARTGELVELARPMNVTFHRAFDMARDPYQALEDLIELGVDRVLTSGQEITAFEGLALIADLVQRAGDRIIVMPGGGIHERNIRKIVELSGAREVHAAAPATIASPMEYRNPNCFMGGELRPPEFALEVTDPSRVRAMLGAIRSQVPSPGRPRTGFRALS
ncbi:MAG: copper homeostasis protein CutC [Anaerolineae bacterium CG2_30_64_16]|nr:MAG: copper homeostasis protein CutC [Anaerolineae bacterium CG2_30_64_16]